MEVFLALSYYESRLKVDPSNLIEVENRLQFCEKLGIKNLIIESGKSNLNLNSKLVTLKFIFEPILSPRI